MVPSGHGRSSRATPRDRSRPPRQGYGGRPGAREAKRARACRGSATGCAGARWHLCQPSAPRERPRGGRRAPRLTSAPAPDAQCTKFAVSLRCHAELPASTGRELSDRIHRPRRRRGTHPRHRRPSNCRTTPLDPSSPSQLIRDRRASDASEAPPVETPRCPRMRTIAARSVRAAILFIRPPHASTAHVLGSHLTRSEATVRRVGLRWAVAPAPSQQS